MVSPKSNMKEVRWQKVKANMYTTDDLKRMLEREEQRKGLCNRVAMYRDGLVSQDDLMGYIQCMLDNGMMTNSECIKCMAIISRIEVKVHD